MRISIPAFGLISGVSTGLGLLPLIGTLCIFLIFGVPARSVTSLVVFTVGTKLLCEWIFWNECKRRMDSEPKLKHWRSVFNQSLWTHPNVTLSLLTMVLDGLIDVLLIKIALTTPLSPIWIFLSILGCQALGSPIQGVFSDFFSQKKCLFFAYVVGLLAMVAILGVFGQPDESLSSSTSRLLKLTSLAPTTQVLIILCGKGLFANITVLARAGIAKVVKVRTAEKFRRAKV